jgi:hypothetical protein
MHLINHRLLAIVFWTAVSTLGLAQSASAANFIVSNTADSGAGSLRQAVLDANAAAGADNVNFGALFNTPQTITLTSGEIPITSQVYINGPLAKLTIDGNLAGRIFNINDGDAGVTPVTLSQLSLVRGASPQPAGRGGAIYIANETLTLFDCTFANNFSNDSGGAININGPDGPLSPVTLYVVRCTFNNNQAPNNGGGAISSYAPLDLNINESTFRGNSAFGGGAIGQFYGGSLNIFASTFFVNQALHVDGGALFLNSAFSSVVITNSTFAQNAANNNGGAIALMTVSSIGSGLNILNSTFGNNGALVSGGAICRRDGSTASITLTSTLFWSNGPRNIFGPDCYTQGTVTADRVLIGSTAGITTFNADAFTTANVGVSPRVNFLAPNGGLTETYSLKPGSIAIDNGSNPLTFMFDQRGAGYARDKDGNCNGTAVADIGAFEAQACLCPGDATGNGSTDIDDLVLIITTWGATWNGYPADLNNDGFVNIDDLVLVITDWGICS